MGRKILKIPSCHPYTCLTAGLDVGSWSALIFLPVSKGCSSVCEFKAVAEKSNLRPHSCSVSSLLSSLDTEGILIPEFLDLGVALSSAFVQRLSGLFILKVNVLHSWVNFPHYLFANFLPFIFSVRFWSQTQPLIFLYSFLLLFISLYSVLTS